MTPVDRIGQEFLVDTATASTQGKPHVTALAD
jgi:hypothetical protein